jgi:hypothetical protein
MEIKSRLRVALRWIWRFVRFWYPVVVLALVLVVLIEFMNRGHWDQARNWMIGKDSHPNELQLNYLAAVSLLLFFIAITGRKWAGYGAAFILAFTVSLISNMKVNTVGAPLYLWDFLLPNETRDVVRNLEKPLNFEVLWWGLAILAAVGLAMFIPHFRMKVGWKSRVALLLASVLGIYVLCTDNLYPIKKNAGIFSIGWDQVSNYERNGFLLSMALGAHLVNPDKPSGYSEKAIKDITSRTPKSTNVSPQNPNIIVLLGESFFDPTQLKDVTYSEDPIPFLHSLMPKYPSGYLLSPQFGGSTANVEFEVLSGLSMRFLPSDAIAYNEYVIHETDSLASIMTRQGYHATAINPFYNWFFNSRNVYKNFGFAKFISSEYFDPIYHGPYLKDSEVMKKIMNETDSTPGPDFIFANTMENHAGYKNKFSDNKIKVTANLSADDINILENYATGANSTDKGLKELVDHYTETKEPTIIVFFGDHLPNMESTLQNAKFIQGKSLNGYLLPRHSTSLLIWDNYLPPHHEELRLSPSLVGPYVLHEAQKPGTYLTDYLYEFSKKIPMIPPKEYYKDLNIDEKDLQDYQRLQYDILFGKRYGYAQQGLHGTIVNDKFMLGNGDPVIKEAAVSSDGKSVAVTGDLFERGSKVFLNGTELNTWWTDRQHLTANLPTSGLQAGKQAELVVKLFDAWNTTISKTPLYAHKAEK